jgi:hypothetical protein
LSARALLISIFAAPAASRKRADLRAAGSSRWPETLSPAFEAGRADRLVGDRGAQRRLTDFNHEIVGGLVLDHAPDRALEQEAGAEHYQLYPHIAAQYCRRSKAG